MADTAIFDVDGTLVDTNYQHALAWYRAFRRFDITPPIWRIHRAIGMGGDQLVPEIAGQETEERHGEALRDAWTEEFDALIDEVQPFDGARDLLVEVKRRGFRLVLASSGKKQHVERFLDLIGGARRRRRVDHLGRRRSQQTRTGSGADGPPEGRRRLRRDDRRLDVGRDRREEARRADDRRPHRGLLARRSSPTPVRSASSTRCASCSTAWTAGPLARPSA